MTTNPGISEPSLVADPAPAEAGPGRVRVVAASLAASALTIAALLATAPWGDRLDSGADEIVTYDDLLTVRDAAWTAMLADAFALGVVGLTLALATCHLVRSRGRVAALVGGVLTTAGGILFAMGGAAFATFNWFASSGGLSEEAGRSLVDYGNDHPGHMIGATLAGFALYTLGTLVLAAALLRSRAVPVLGVATFVLLTLAQFAPLPGRAIDVLQIAMMALLAAFAAVVWKAA
jgi:hypothetical protein